MSRDLPREKERERERERDCTFVCLFVNLWECWMHLKANNHNFLHFAFPPSFFDSFHTKYWWLFFSTMICSLCLVWDLCLFLFCHTDTAPKRSLTQDLY